MYLTFLLFLLIYIEFFIEEESFYFNLLVDGTVSGKVKEFSKMEMDINTDAQNPLFYN